MNNDLLKQLDDLIAAARMLPVTPWSGNALSALQTGRNNLAWHFEAAAKVVIAKDTTPIEPKATK
jgi:hypothetical protein